MKAHLKIQWLAAMAADPRLEHSAIRLAVSLADHCNPQTGQCNPGVSTLAKTANMGETTVKRVRKKLIDTGWIKRSGSAGGRGHSVGYDLLMDNMTNPASSGPLCDKEEGKETRPPAAPFIDDVNPASDSPLSQTNPATSGPLSDDKPGHFGPINPATGGPRNSKETEELSHYVAEHGSNLDSVGSDSRPNAELEKPADQPLSFNQISRLLVNTGRWSETQVYKPKTVIPMMRKWAQSQCVTEQDIGDIVAYCDAQTGGNFSPAYMDKPMADLQAAKNQPHGQNEDSHYAKPKPRNAGGGYTDLLDAAEAKLLGGQHAATPGSDQASETAVRGHEIDVSPPLELAVQNS